jgi:hypothetical protein
MKLIALLLTALAVAASVATVEIAFYAGMKPSGLSHLFLDSMPTTQLADMLLGLGVAVMVVLGPILLATDRRGDGAGFLGAMAWIGPLLGVVVCLYETMHIWIAVVRTHTTNFRVVAPSVSEALLPLSLGLVAGAMAALWRLAMGGRRGQRRAA